MFFSSKKKTSVVGMDIGSTSIKLVDLSNTTQSLSLATYAELTLGAYAGLVPGQAVKLGTQKLAEAISDTYKESKSTSAHLVASLPMTDCQIFSLSLPLELESEFATIVPVEVRKFTPVPISELIVSYEKLPFPSEQPNKVNVVVLAVKQNAMTGLRDLLQQTLPMETIVVEPSIFGAIRSLPIKKTGMSMIVDLGATQTTVACLIDGVLVGCTTINRGQQEITTNIKNSLTLTFEEAETLKKSFIFNELGSNPLLADIIKISLGHIVEEVIHIRNRYEMRYTQKCAQVWLIGGGAHMHSVRDIVSQELNNGPVLCEIAIGTPFDRVVVPEVMRSMIQTQGSLFANAIGLSLSQLD